MKIPRVPPTRFWHQPPSALRRGAPRHPKACVLRAPPAQLLAERLRLLHLADLLQHLGLDLRVPLAVRRGHQPLRHQ